MDTRTALVAVKCKKDIEESVRLFYNGNTFNTELAVDRLLNLYTFDIVVTTISCMIVCCSERDVRISREVRNYAIFNTNCINDSMISKFRSNTHSGLLDLLCKQLMMLDNRGRK